MHAAQTLDLQADLMVRSQGRLFREMIKTQLSFDLVERAGDTRKVTKDAFISSREADSIADQIARGTAPIIRQASAYYIAPAMSDLVEAAALGLDDTDQFRMDEIPTASGFAYFERGLAINDVRGKVMIVHAIIWFPLKSKMVNTEQGTSVELPGTGILSFNDMSNQPDEVAEELKAAGYTLADFGRWQLIGLSQLTEGQVVGDSVILPPKHKQEQAEEEGWAPHTSTNLARLIHAYWLLLNQTVTHVTDSEIPRAFAKRARRMEIPDRVTIVALRRTSGNSHHDESDVDWQYRWIVRGHWRWQHVSRDHELAEPDGEGGYRARVWVRPHVKGPEDKPLHITDKVYALVR